MGKLRFGGFPFNVYEVAWLWAGGREQGDACMHSGVGECGVGLSKAQAESWRGILMHKKEGCAICAF